MIIMHTFTEDKVFSDLFETITIAIQDCKDELGHVDYATCIDHWQQIFIDDLIEKYAVWFYDGGNQYKDATIRIDGYTFSLENVYNEAMKGEN